MSDQLPGFDSRMRNLQQAALEYALKRLNEINKLVYQVKDLARHADECCA